MAVLPMDGVVNRRINRAPTGEDATCTRRSADSARWQWQCCQWMGSSIAGYIGLLQGKMPPVPVGAQILRDGSVANRWGRQSPIHRAPTGEDATCTCRSADSARWQWQCCQWMGSSIADKSGSYRWMCRL